MWKKVKLLKMSNFAFFHNVFYAICILKSFNSHVSIVIFSFFEFGAASKLSITERVKCAIIIGKNGSIDIFIFTAGVVIFNCMFHMATIFYVCAKQGFPAMLTENSLSIVFIHLSLLFSYLSRFYIPFSFWNHVDVYYRLLCPFPKQKFFNFQIKRVCRRQFLMWWKWRRVLQKDRKHMEKGEIACDKQFLLFPQCFQKACEADR